MSYDDRYKAWHESLGHREWRVTVSMYGYGRDEDAAEALLEAFLEKYPEGGPVVSQNIETEHTSVTFVVTAGDPNHAASLAQIAFIEGASCSGLPPVEWGGFEIVPVADDDAVTEERKAVTA